MARPQRHNVDYFPHYISDGKKMFIIESKFGNDGYASWFKILETLAKTDNHWIDLKDESNLMFLSAKCRIKEETLLELIDAVVKLGEIDGQLWKEQKVIWCQKFVDSVEDAYRKRNNQCITKEGLIAVLRGLGRNIGRLGRSEGGENPQSKGEETKPKETKPKETEEDFDFLDDEIDLSKPDYFELFWIAYGSGTNKTPSQREWREIDSAEYPKIVEHAPRFVKASGAFLKSPVNYLKDRCWLDEDLPNYGKQEPKNTTILQLPKEYPKNSWDE